MRMRPACSFFAILSSVLILMMGVGHLSAQVPSLLDYDGYMSGNITGNRTIGVKLYNASTNGTLLYSENIGTVKVTNGEFYFQYGANGTAGNSTTPTTIEAVLNGSEQWLGLTVNGTAQPRERLVAVPFALRSADAQLTDTALRQVMNEVGKLVVAFGGNASNLVSDPAGAISTVEKTAKDLLEVQKAFRVIGVTGNLSFGNSTGVQDKTTKVLDIANTGFTRLTVSGITYPSGFSGAWNGTIAPGSKQSVTVTFTPTALQAYSGNIIVASDASSGVGSIAVSGQGVSGQGVRNIVLSGNLSFGNGTMNAASQQSLTIFNTGTVSLTVSGITYPSGFSGSWSSGTIAAGASQNVTVTFMPTSAQAYSGNITVNSNVFGGTATLAVSGVGIAPMVNVPRGSFPSTSKVGQTIVVGYQTVENFQIGKYEVTWGEWKSVRDWAVSNNKGYDLAGVGGTFPAGSADNFPVCYVSWYDVVKWCNAKSEKEGKEPAYQSSGGIYRSGNFGRDGSSAVTVKASAKGYRLPTEKEWEWAARGAVGDYPGYMYSGSNFATDVGWVWNLMNPQDFSTKAVGRKLANQLGIYDMTGNLSELCWDEAVQSRRVRGGYWWSYTVETPQGIPASVAFRGDNTYANPVEQTTWFGFRVARNPEN